MALRMLDITEVAFGGAVTLADWWDEKRIADATLTDKDVLKKASFWTYLAVGLPATLATAMGWWRRQEGITERLAHGFLYGLPGFLYATVKSLGTTTAAGRVKSDAVTQAQEILRQRAAQQAAAHSTNMRARTGGVTNAPIPEVITRRGM